jgi:hypothetical protein
MGTFKYVNILMYIKIYLYSIISKAFRVGKFMRSTDPFNITYKYEISVGINAVMFVLSPYNV